MEATPAAAANQHAFESQFQELVQGMQRDFNCLGDANRATRTSALDRLRKKLLPLDGKVTQSLICTAHFGHRFAYRISLAIRSSTIIRTCLFWPY